MATENNKKKSKKKFILIGIGLGTLGLLGFGWWYFKGRKGTTVDDTEKDLFHSLSEDTGVSVSTPKVNTSGSATSNLSVHNSGFPLKKGSKGELVKQVQNALIKKYGKNILPKYGADGDFGSEMTAALQSKGYNTVVDLAEFTKIISDAGTGTPAKSESNSGSAASTIVDTAKQIYLSLSPPSLTKLLAALKQLKTVDDYTKANDLFKTVRLNGVHQTIVNATLASFSDDTSKQLIRAEFIRMGLKYDGSKWSLSGINGRQLISTATVTIYNSKGLSLNVPENTILGREIATSHGITTFRTIDNQLLFASSKHIRYA